mmetsp:Transcript_6968/g.14344  ORF Transcript_6968/g.14344 Transcript_6968/m.14344 type:complete len:251 (+) Transcript_6968:111-863(+)
MTKSTLPLTCLKEILSMAKARQPPSPTSVTANRGHVDTISSEVEPIDETIQVVSNLATRFLKDVVAKTLIFTQHYQRMTVYPIDVVFALEEFAVVDAPNYSMNVKPEVDEDGDQAMECEESDDSSWVMDGDNIEHDDDLSLRCVFSEDYPDDDQDFDDWNEDETESTWVDTVQNPANIHNANVFNDKFPPIRGENWRITDAEFHDGLLKTVLTEFIPPFADGAVGVIKKAMFSFLVTKLSSSSRFNSPQL